MTDFFENFSDSIEENAGAYAALGGLAALRGQNAQNQKLDEIKKTNEKANKIELERLELERKRLAIEKARVNDQKSLEQSIKSLRKLMVDVDSELRYVRKKFPI